ncbi:hypothetical protein BDQ12DRAFT_635426 [Crucibulum laeve]|uniref:Uncharacterized protein n=1 Tax=Crucibulum laeve TaxID=68775 RepID=A0A5C3LQN6_9AGAR|nr:hypothetical protein BDQ12DRAFT_635426 [Crucibulum laeve]
MACKLDYRCSTLCSAIQGCWLPQICPLSFVSLHLQQDTITSSAIAGWHSQWTIHPIFFSSCTRSQHSPFPLLLLLPTPSDNPIVTRPVPSRPGRSCLLLSALSLSLSYTRCYD